MNIREDDLTGKKIIELLKEHLRHMHEITPLESVHALDLEALKSPEISFWSAWDDDILLGCVALKELSAQSGEIKSMRTVTAYRRCGIAKQLLEYVIQESINRGYSSLSLETGAAAEFRPARRLYERRGFAYRGPFGSYTKDPNSVFMTLQLTDIF